MKHRDSGICTSFVAESRSYDTGKLDGGKERKGEGTIFRLLRGHSGVSVLQGTTCKTIDNMLVTLLPTGITEAGSTGTTGNNVAFTLVDADTATTKVTRHLLQHVSQK